MCLAIPARIVELEGDKAVVDAMGNRWKAKTTLLPQAKLGDLVLIHAGFAISLIDEEEAKKTWKLIEEINDFQQTQNKITGPFGTYHTWADGCLNGTGFSEKQALPGLYQSAQNLAASTSGCVFGGNFCYVESFKCVEPAVWFF